MKVLELTYIVCLRSFILHDSFSSKKMCIPWCTNYDSLKLRLHTILEAMKCWIVIHMNEIRDNTFFDMNDIIKLEETWCSIEFYFYVLIKLLKYFVSWHICAGRNSIQKKFWQGKHYYTFIASTKKFWECHYWWINFCLF